MGYHDVRLPESFSAGSLFGPSFLTKIITLDSMAEHRIQRGPSAGRRQYALQHGIKGLDDLYELYEFFLARQGALNSFRLKDWLDYATTPTGTTHRDSDDAVAYDDEDLVEITAGSMYQLVKRYTSGSTTVVRTITKPVSGTVKVGDAGGVIASGYTVDYQTGRVTFSSPPTGQVTGGCEFDVPVRFSEETDRALSIGIEAVNSGSLPEIRCVEDVDPVVVSQDFPFGGAKNHGAIATDVSVSDLDGRLQIFEPSAPGKSIILPDLTSLPLGGPYFCFKNAGSQSLKIKSYAGATLLDPFSVGAIKTVWLGISTGSVKTWYIV